MTQITAMKLGLIAICFASVPLSLAQMPRTGTSRGNQSGVVMGATAGHSGVIGNSTGAPQLGTNPPGRMSTGLNTNAGTHIGGLGSSSGNSIGTTQIGTDFRSSTITAPNTNVGGRIGINPGAQTGISNQTGGITGGAGELGGVSSDSTGTTQSGTNARAGTNSTANTNAGAHAAAAAAAPASETILIQPIRVATPSPNNSPIGSNFSTAGESPSPLPSASVTPTPTPSPAQLL